MPTSAEAAILCHTEPPYATITLNRPQRGNALTPELQGTLVDYLQAAAADPLVHFIILRAKGKFFCTGMDLSASGSSLGGGAQTLFEKSRSFFEYLEAYPMPIIAIAQGPSFGGGCGIFFSADIRLSLETATFQLTEVRRGLVPALISPTIIREWGVPLAREAMLSSRAISALELRQNGAIASTFATVAEGEQQLRELIANIRKGGPQALQTCKSLVRSQASTGLSIMPPASDKAHQAYENIYSAFTTMMGPSEEAVQGIMNFRESKGKTDVDWLEFYRSKL